MLLGSTVDDESAVVVTVTERVKEGATLTVTDFAVRADTVPTLHVMLELLDVHPPVPEMKLTLDENVK